MNASNAKCIVKFIFYIVVDSIFLGLFSTGAMTSIICAILSTLFLERIKWSLLAGISIYILIQLIISIVLNKKRVNKDV